MGAFSAFENSVTMLVVIHTFLFVLYFIGSIFIFFKHSFDDFQTIDWHPSVRAITHTIAVSSSLWHFHFIGFHYRYSFQEATVGEAQLMCTVFVSWLISFHKHR
jgi:hypothetical protein